MINSHHIVGSIFFFFVDSLTVIFKYIEYDLVRACDSETLIALTMWQGKYLFNINFHYVAMFTLTALLITLFILYFIMA